VPVSRLCEKRIKIVRDTKVYAGGFTAFVKGSRKIVTGALTVVGMKKFNNLKAEIVLQRITQIFSFKAGPVEI